MKHFKVYRNFKRRSNNITSKSKIDVTWDDFKNILSEVIAKDLRELLRKGIKAKSNGGENKAQEDINIPSSDAYKMKHSVIINIFKKNYIKCYNADNGIQESCFITTTVCESFNKTDDCFELTTFRNFRDNWLALQSDGKNLIEEYYKIAPQIVANINKLTRACW